MVDLDNIFVKFDLCGTPKTDAAMKAHAMSRIGPQWRSVALLLGNDEGVSYLDWQAAMLEKEREEDATGEVGARN